MSNWIDVRKKLPEIPKGRYGLRVLVCEYDSAYDEWNPFEKPYQYPPVSSGGGCTVREVHYGSIYDREGKQKSTFNPKFGEFQFMELWQGYDPDCDWVPLMDQVTHWCYLPEPLPYDTIWNEEKERLVYVYRQERYCDSCGYTTFEKFMEYDRCPICHEGIMFIVDKEQE